MKIVYYHPACWTSFRLIKKIGPRNDVRLIDCSEDIGLPMSKNLLTVPMIEIDGEFIYGGPVDITKALALIENKCFDDEPINIRGALLTGIADSAAASAIVYVTGGLDQLLNFEPFLVASTGIGLSKKKETLMAQLKDLIVKENSNLYREVEADIIKTLTYNFIRESLYMGLGVTRKDEFIRWLEAKASVGRVGVPFNKVTSLSEKGARLFEYFRANEVYITEKLKREMDVIVHDAEFRRLRL